MMHLIFEKQIIEIYFNNHSPGTKEENVRLIKNIFEDERNKFLITERMLNRMESDFSSNHKLEQYFQTFVTDIIDCKRFLECTSENNDESEELLEVFNNKRQHLDDLFILAFVCNNIYETIANDNFHHICFFSNIHKANKCWFIFQLLSNKMLSLRYSDFLSNKEIKDFFTLFFKLPLISKDISILDSYCNSNTVFQSIKKNGYRITFYTSCYQKKENDLKLLRDSIRATYGTNTKIKFSLDKKILHERTIVIGNFILESNHDFAEIRRENENWKIDISYSSSIKSEIENKTQKYN